MRKNTLNPKKLKSYIAERVSKRHFLTTGVVVSAVLIAIVGDVAAVSHPPGALLQDGGSLICTADGNKTFLGDAVEAAMRFVTLSAVPVFIVLYALDGLLELFALGADTKAKIKKHERNMWLGAAKIYLAPIGIWLFAGALGVDVGGCVNILPFT